MAEWVIENRSDCTSKKSKQNPPKAPRQTISILNNWAREVKKQYTWVPTVSNERSCLVLPSWKLAETIPTVTSCVMEAVLVTVEPTGPKQEIISMCPGTNPLYTRSFAWLPTSPNSTGPPTPLPNNHPPTPTPSPSFPIFPQLTPKESTDPDQDRIELKTSSNEAHTSDRPLHTDGCYKSRQNWSTCTNRLQWFCKKQSRDYTKTLLTSTKVNTMSAYCSSLT